MEHGEINPYTAQRSASQALAPVSPTDARPAGLGKRFLNWTIDRVGVIATFALIVKIISLLEWVMSWKSFVNFPENIGTIVFTLAGVYLAAVFVYYTCFEGLLGRTLGQLITGTKVVTTSGAPLTFRCGFLRSLVRMVPLDALSLYNTNADSGWHDCWTSTRVVDLLAGPEIRPRPMPARQLAVFRPGEKRAGQ